MIIKIISNLKKRVPEKLLNHIFSVTITAYDLAQYYDVDTKACVIAALMHDYVKKDELDYEMIKKEDQHEYLKQNPEVWHGYIASYIAKEEYHINDEKILQAIKYHTTGCEKMNDVAKIVFIADTIEPLRSFKNLVYLQAKEKTLEEHFNKIVKNTLCYLTEKNIELGPDTKALKKELKL